MKQILIILGLFASVSTFAQSPRIKLNQITKDTVKGSVLISSPSDSGMVYSRDFYVAYGADTVLILYGDTLAATSGIISSVLSDGVTITGNGTSGNELKVDTLLIATIKALNDSLATISASTTPDGVTITGDGSVGNPLKVDTLLISTIKGLNDTLTNRGYLTANQTITLSGDVTGSGTTAIAATVVDDSHNHIISNVDFLQDSLDAKANDSDLANYVTLSGADTITGAKTFTNTFTQSGGDANFDSGTLYVDESANKVGIGTSSPTAPLEIATYSDKPSLRIGALNFQSFSINNAFLTDNLYFAPGGFRYTANGKGSIFYFIDGGFVVRTSPNNTSGSDAIATTYDKFNMTNAGGFSFGSYANLYKGADTIIMPGPVGIGTSLPSYPLEMGSGAHVTTGGVWTDASDIKLKENINYYYSYGLNEIMNLKPTVFDYINGEKNSLGFIAQDVFEVIPEAISSTIDENGNETMGIKMVSITATLVKAIQEQQTEIDQLKTLITDLTNRLIILENK